MAKTYHDADADLSLIQAKKVAIIGYGSQGHAHALNLKDSGVDVRVGLRPDYANVDRARKAGLVVGTVAEVSKWADVIMNLTPDQTAAKVYHAEIEPNLVPGNTLMFAHGFNIRFRTIQPPAFVDVSMVAPKAPGHRVREIFVEGGRTVQRGMGPGRGGCPGPGPPVGGDRRGPRRAGRRAGRGRGGRARVYGPG